MAVTVADFVLPPDGTGELDPAWWATGVLEDDLLPVWIVAGVAQAPAGSTAEQVDAVTVAYTYATAYDAKAAQIAGNPNRVNIGGAEFNEEYQKHQQAFFEAKAAAWWLRFSSAVTDATAPVEEVVVYDPPRASSSVRATISF